MLVCGKHISLKNPSLGGDFRHKVGRSVVTHRLGSGTGFGCKYWELVSEVRQRAVLNLFLPQSTSCGARVEVVTKALTSGVNSMSLLRSFYYKGIFTRTHA